MDTAPAKLKIVLLGDSGVGKSSIVLRYVTDSFKTDSDATVGASYMGKIITLNENLVKLNIWDTAGQERYHSLAKMYYRDADVAIIVYDITNSESFQGMKKWYNEVKQNSKNNILVAIAGNKEDLISSEVIGLEEAQAYAYSINALFKKTSAKNNYGIDQLFKEIVIESCPEIKNSAMSKKSLMLEKKNDQKPEKKNCCL